MSISTLRQLERKYATKQAPAAVPTGTSLDAIIEAMVDARVAEQMEKQQREPQGVKLRRVLDDFRQPAEPFRHEPDTRGPLPNSSTPQPRQLPPMTITRDELRRISTINIGSQAMRVQRDSFGMIVGLAPADDAGEITYSGQPVRGIEED